MQIILIDNYDSFTWNIVHYLEQCDCVVSIIQNDAKAEPLWDQYDACVISPGPGMPEESGNLLRWIEKIPSTFPVLGICLGLQSLVVASGGSLHQMKEPLHGVQTNIQRQEKSRIWKSLSAQCLVGHYHSWVAESDHLPVEWKVIYRDNQNRIMAIEHSLLNRCAVQFHPESILTEDGMHWISDWVSSCKN